MKRTQLSKEERRGEEAFASHEKIKAFYNLVRQTHVEIFKELQTIYNNQWYKDILGDEEATWKGYLNLKEIDSTKAEVDKAFRVMHKLVGEFGLNPETVFDVKITRLADVVRFAKDKTEAIELIEKADALDAGDWEKERRVLLGKPVVDDGHQHEDHDFKICSKCSRKKRIDA